MSEVEQADAARTSRKDHDSMKLKLEQLMAARLDLVALIEALHELPPGQRSAKKFLSLIAENPHKEQIMIVVIDEGLRSLMLRIKPRAQVQAEQALERERIRSNREKRNADHKERLSRRRDNEDYAARYGIPLTSVADHKLNAALVPVREAFEKAKFADRVVEMLDKHFVGTRRLGDCSGAHLTAAAARERALSSQHAAASAFYTRLAEIVPAKQRVRDVEDRKSVLAVCEQFLSDNLSKTAA